MNSVILVGRLTTDPELRYTSGENAKATTRFTVAVNRPFKNAEGNYDADFIRCVAWDRSAETICKWLNKGSAICINGNIRTGSYKNKDGQTVYTTEVWVDRFEFVGGRNSNDSAPQKNTKVDTTGWSSKDDDDEDVPWDV